MSLPRVVLSMTTYPARIKYVAQVLKPLLRQTVPPDAIYIWLVKDEFLESGTNVPDELLAMTSYGVEIRWCEVNLKPHNKYYWTMTENPDDIVITVDDDIVYPLTMVQSLLETHYRHPDAVVANRTHRVVLENGSLAPYANWIMEQNQIHDEPRSDLIATGVGGVLYPPRIFDDEVFNIKAIEDTSLLADDMWLQVHELRLGVPIVNTWGGSYLHHVPGSQNEGLYKINLEAGRNDAILAVLLDRYPSARQALLSSLKSHRDSSKTIEDDKLNSGFVARLKRKLVSHG